MPHAVERVNNHATNNKECVYHYRLQDINHTAILGPPIPEKKKGKKEMGARRNHKWFDGGGTNKIGQK